MIIGGLSTMQQKNNLSQHLTLAIITLLLAIALLVLTFIPRQPVIRQYQGAPTGGDTNQIAPPASSGSLAQVAHGQLIMPQFTLSAS
jgi:hypothetical protein